MQQQINQMHRQLSNQRNTRFKLSSHFDGNIAVRVGVPNPDHLSKTMVMPDQSLRKALGDLPMFANRDFVIHRMENSPGSFFPRLARPGDQHPDEGPGSLPCLDWSLIIGSLNQVQSLVGMLNEIIQSVHPVDTNMSCFGSTIRNLLILACTECETQWRGILTANGYAQDRPTSNDFVKLQPAMRLNEYVVRLEQFPWLPGIRPFEDWHPDKPTQSIPWYDAYNASKHDRENNFGRANLGAAIESMAAVWIMIAAQFGVQGIRKFPDLNRYFSFERVPKWRYSEVYIQAYTNFGHTAGPRHYQF